MMVVSEAKRLVRQKWGKLPRPGYEMLADTHPIDQVDPGYHNRWIAETNRSQKWQPKITRVSFWLVNEAGSFRVREQYHYS